MPERKARAAVVRRNLARAARMPVVSAVPAVAVAMAAAPAMVALPGGAKLVNISRMSQGIYQRVSEHRQEVNGSTTTQWNHVRSQGTGIVTEKREGPFRHK